MQLTLCRWFHETLTEVLQTLSGFDPRTTTDKQITQLVQRFTRVTCIDCSNCGQLTDASVIAIANNCANLAQLNVSGCFRLTRESPLSLLSTAFESHSLKCWVFVSPSKAVGCGAARRPGGTIRALPTSTM